MNCAYVEKFGQYSSAESEFLWKFRTVLEFSSLIQRRKLRFPRFSPFFVVLISGLPWLQISFRLYLTILWSVSPSVELEDDCSQPSGGV